MARTQQQEMIRNLRRAISRTQERIREVNEVLRILERNHDLFGDSTASSSPTRAQNTPRYRVPLPRNAQTQTPPAISQSDFSGDSTEPSCSRMFQPLMDIRSRNRILMNAQEETPPDISQNEIPATEEGNRDLPGDSIGPPFSRMFQTQVVISSRNRILMNAQEETPPASVQSEEIRINCVICQNTSGNTEMKALPCRHEFHEKCIDAWLNRNSRCPLCRHESANSSLYERFSSDAASDIFGDEDSDE